MGPLFCTSACFNFTYNGPVSVLKKMTVSFMSAVIINHISCQKLPHAIGQQLVPRSDEETMIAHKSPGIDLQRIYFTKIGKTL